MQFLFRSWLIFLISLIITGCSGVKFSEWHFPYTMEVQQGIYITKQQVSQIKVGMTKEQVSFIIGRPLTQFMFDQNRWDYFYQDYKNNTLEQSYTVSILFDSNDQVIKVNSSGQFFDK